MGHSSDLPVSRQYNLSSTNNEEDISYAPHEEYYLDIAELVVEDCLFKVPACMLTGDLAPITPQSRQSVSRHEVSRPLILNGVKKLDFERLLRLLYPLNVRPAPFIFKEWVSVLRLSTLWSLPTIRDLALETMSHFPVKPIEKVMLSQEFDVVEWLVPAFDELASLLDLLSKEDGRKIGLEAVLEIVHLREQRRPCTCLHSSQPNATVKKNAIPKDAKQDDAKIQKKICTEENPPSNISNDTVHKSRPSDSPQSVIGSSSLSTKETEKKGSDQSIKGDKGYQAQKEAAKRRAEEEWQRYQAELETMEKAEEAKLREKEVKLKIGSQRKTVQGEFSIVSETSKVVPASISNVGSTSVIIKDSIGLGEALEPVRGSTLPMEPIKHEASQLGSERASSTHKDDNPSKHTQPTGVMIFSTEETNPSWTSEAISRRAQQESRYQSANLLLQTAPPPRDLSESWLNPQTPTAIDSGIAVTQIDTGKLSEARTKDTTPATSGIVQPKATKGPTTKIDTTNLAKDENWAEQGKVTPKEGEGEEDSWFGLGGKKKKAAAGAAVGKTARRR